MGARNCQVPHNRHFGGYNATAFGRSAGAGTMPVQRHVVVIVRQDGGVEVHALKEWLRQHPNILPGVDPNSTISHQLRAALLRQNWAKEETPSEFRMFPPEPMLTLQS